MKEVPKPLPHTPGEGRGPRIANPDRPRGMSRSPERHQSPKKNKKKDIQASADDDDDFEFFHEFNREKVKDVIHHITTFLKQNAMDIEYLMIPFRPEQNNEKLLKFLNAIFPLGNGQPVNEKSQLRIINKTDVWTLFQSLKYIWCRLPNAEIVGWKAYLKFKYKEIDKKYPQKAFLEIMPQCLESPNHASIVYDFFDLIVTLSSNSKVNKMSARKISKMCAIWAFKRANIKNEEGEDIMNDNSNNPSFDFDANNPKHGKISNSFQDGLNEWIPASDAMFHLLLAFLKSFVPKDLESSKLPKSLKSILFNNEYPPKGSTAYSSQTILTIPLVTLYTDQFSRKPWQLLERCNEMLDFSDYDAFEAREDYALLKSLFKKKNNVEGISRKMSQESRRLMKIMSTKHSTFQAGWAPRQCLANKFNQKENIEIKRVDIDDYFIWAWLSTLSYEETSEKKKIFGRSLILEFEFDGFKKWVIFQECDITLHYESISQLKKKQLELQSEKQELTPNNSNESDKKGKPLPKVRNATPVYEKFQNEVPNRSVMKTDHSTLNGPSTTRQGQYHTVIDKSTLHKNNKNNLHALEEKISKWNPLHNLRKKSNSNVSQRSGSGSSSEMRAEFASSSIYDPTQSRTTKPDTYMEVPTKSKPRVASHYSILDPQKYKLPDIEKDEEGFNIDLSKIGAEIDDIQPMRQKPMRQEPTRQEQIRQEPQPQYQRNEPPPNDPYANQQYQRVDPQSAPQPTLPLPKQPQPVQQQQPQPLPQPNELYYEQEQPVQNNVSAPPMLSKPTEPAYMSQASVATSSNSSSDRKGRFSATETLEELSDMVEDMIIHDDVIKVQAEKTFEDMTKFDQYKPKEFDAESSTSSAVQSLKINTPVDERQRSLQNLNANVSGTNYRERINFNEKNVDRDAQTLRNDYSENNNYNHTPNGDENQQRPTYQNTGFVAENPYSPQRGRTEDNYRNNQSPVRQNQSISPVRVQQAQPQAPNRSPERGRQGEVQQQRMGYNNNNNSNINGYDNIDKQPYTAANISPGGNQQGNSPTRQNPSPTRHNVPIQQQPMVQNVPSQPQSQMGQTHLSSQYNQKSKIINNKYGQSQPQLPVGNNDGNVNNNMMNPQRSPQPQNRGNGNRPHSTSPIRTQPVQQQQQGYNQAPPPPQNFNKAPPSQQSYNQPPQQQHGYNQLPMNDGGNYYQDPRYNNNGRSRSNGNGGNNAYPTGMNQGQMSMNMQQPRVNMNYLPPQMMNKSPMRGHSPSSMGSYNDISLQSTGIYPQPPMNKSPRQNNMMDGGYPSPQPQYQHQHHPPTQNMAMPMNMNRSPQLDGYAGYVHPQHNTQTPNNPMIPSDIPMAVPHNTVGMKLHGNNINKRQERKQLYNNIRSGNFGI
ncbi:hypothetical protein C6P44_002555 [Monosporozyma unispora]|nr:hypothetical protein C6P44_002555 [Kazachstania unispora]